MTNWPPSDLPRRSKRNTMEAIERDAGDKFNLLRRFSLMQEHNQLPCENRSLEDGQRNNHGDHA